MSNSIPTGWRIAKACQDCRKRKIGCSGLNPCKTCQLRNTPCVYRDYIRHRKKKNECQEANREDDQCPGRQYGDAGVNAIPSTFSARQVRLGLAQPSGQQNSSVMHILPNSVSATHNASSPCQAQLYYGPASHFALTQHIYRDLFSTPRAYPELSGGPEEGGAGLDLLDFRRIFFGDLDTHAGGKKGCLGHMPVIFLPFEMAKLFLSRFLSTFYYITPYCPKSHFEQCLEQLYNSSSAKSLDTLTQAIILLATAIGSLSTEYFGWGDVLFDHVKASLAAYEEQYANYQSEQSRPNSAFLHLGNAIRKALSAGLHKNAPEDYTQTPEEVEERNKTFWSLYLLETWSSFHTGRPTSLFLKDVMIECTKDPFIRELVSLCTVISRSTNGIYGEQHGSPLDIWRAACSIAEDLRSLAVNLKDRVGFELDSSIQTGSLGVRQTIYTNLYYHTLLLTFRPFLVFRGRLQRDMNIQTHPSNSFTANHRVAMPSWLNQACSQALIAAQKTIHHLCQAYLVNDSVQQLRYHGYFLGSSSITLMYAFIHDTNAVPVHLPWVHAALETLSTMRAGKSISSNISAIQTMLGKINLSYVWSPYSEADWECAARPEQKSPSQQPSVYEHGHQPTASNKEFPPNPSSGTINPLTFPRGPLQAAVPKTGGPGESSFDFIQSDMTLDLDLSISNFLRHSFS
ncbi:C6 zinc finger domain protein [Aspergillus californicus]